MRQVSSTASTAHRRPDSQTAVGRPSSPASTRTGRGRFRGLPPNLFYGTGIPATILVLRARGDAKPPERRGRVLFIHAAEYYEEGKNQNYLREEDIERIVSAFREYRDVERFARVVDLDEIRQNDYNLNISRYVDTSLPEERVDVAEALARLRELERQRDEAARRMDELLAELGYAKG